jgi:hypothetical protein
LRRISLFCQITFVFFCLPFRLVPMSGHVSKPAFLAGYLDAHVEWQPI